MGHAEVEGVTCEVVVDKVSVDVLAIDSDLGFPSLETFPEDQVRRIVDTDDRYDGLGGGLGLFCVFRFRPHISAFRQWGFGDGHIVGRPVARVLNVPKLFDLLPITVTGPSRYFKLKDGKLVSDLMFLIRAI